MIWRRSGRYDRLEVLERTVRNLRTDVGLLTDEVVRLQERVKFLEDHAITTRLKRGRW